MPLVDLCGRGQIMKKIISGILACTILGCWAASTRMPLNSHGSYADGFNEHDPDAYTVTDGGITFEKNWDMMVVTDIDNSLVECNIPSSVDDLPVRTLFFALDGCSSLRSLYIPGTVNEIIGTFNDCTSLETLKIGEGAESFATSFHHIYSLRSVTLPSTIREIPYTQFTGCSNLSNVNMSDNVEKIGVSAFSNCTSLTTVDLPSNLKSLGEYSFAYCPALTSVTIPDGITSIPKQAFFKDESLKTLKNGKNIVTIENSAFWETGLETLVLPERVRTIGDAAFANCKDLTTLKLNDRLAVIGESAFNGCEKLERAVLPESVTSVGECAFWLCDELKEIAVLNPKCSLNKFTRRGNHTITMYGYDGSTAEEYAAAYDYIVFKSLGPMPKKPGDVNDDFSVDSPDAAMILKHYAQMQGSGKAYLSDEQKAVADYNADGAIDSSDAAMILKTYATNQAG